MLNKAHGHDGHWLREAFNRRELPIDRIDGHGKNLWQMKENIYKYNDLYWINNSMDMMDIRWTCRTLSIDTIDGQTWTPPYLRCP